MAKKQIVSNKTAESAPVSPLIVDNVDALKARMAEVRAAQQEFATFTQEQVDKIFQAAAIAANQMRIPLAKMAVEETGMGVVEDKVIKNNYAAEYIYNAYKNTKTCDVIEEDKAFGTMKVAEPIGVVAAVIPTTNPTSTAIFKTLICLKTRNGIIISPHPRAKKSTIAAAKVVLDAAVAAGAPKGIIAWIDVPSLDLTNEVMRSADIILATGGPGMVKAAYSSGKPALGVGAGNTPAIIDTTADIKLAVASIVHSKTFDNGMICASEQSVIVLDKIYDKVKKEFAALGCYFLNPEETEKVRKTILINGALNAKIVGQKAAGDMKKAQELCDKQGGSVANVVTSTLRKYADVENDATLSKDQKVLAIQKELEEATALELPMMEQNLPVIGTITTLGTLMGLLGTVIGMIRSFAALSAGGGTDSMALSQGISEALINTAFGILTGALAVISYNYYTNKIDKLTYSLDEVGFSIVQTFAASHK